MGTQGFYQREKEEDGHRRADGPYKQKHGFKVSTTFW